MNGVGLPIPQLHFSLSAAFVLKVLMQKYEDTATNRDDLKSEVSIVKVVSCAELSW